MIPASKIKRRRRNSGEFKDKVLAECDAQNVSTAEIVHRYGINDNMIYNWCAEGKPSSHDSFVQLPTSTPTVSAAVSVLITTQLGQASH